MEHNNVIKTEKSINFKALEKYKIKNFSWLPDSNIGVIDVETYYNNNKNVYQIYALGFRNKLDNNPVIFYIDENLNSSSLVLNMINELLRSKYSDITFYCHNFGGFYVIFILKILNDYNDKNKDKYKILPILRDDKIIKLTIKKDKASLTILDSYCVLTSNLYKLAKDFNVKTQKSYFPYKFYTQNHLFYKGITPDRDLY